MTPVDSHVMRYELDPTTRYLACTNGLTDVVHDAIAAVLGDQTGAEAVFTLWKAAIDAGGPDNITLAPVEMVDPAPGTRRGRLVIGQPKGSP